VLELLVAILGALNHNWKTLVRRARAYRDHQYLLRELRFMVANPVMVANPAIRRARRVLCGA
jgi:hypothetical protein